MNGKRYSGTAVHASRFVLDPDRDKGVLKCPG
jgi:hypothetical protein